MSPDYFSASYDRMSNQKIMVMIGWVAGKGKEFDVLNAPIIYPDLTVNAKKVFGNWFIIAKFVKVAVGGKMSIYLKSGRGGGPNPYYKMWRLKACTPGLIACGVTLMIFLLSPDQQFPGSGVGATSSISYSTVFRAVKRFFVMKWAHSRVQAIVKNMNDYIFENIDQTTHDADHTQAAGMEDFTDSLQWVMASLDDDDSDSDDNAPVAAPPANIDPSAIYYSAPAVPLPPVPPAPIITPVPLPAPSVSITPTVTISTTHILTPIPESSQSIPAAIRNNNDGHSRPILPAPQTAPTTAPTPVAVSPPRSHPTAIPADVAAAACVEGGEGGDEGMEVTVQKKGRRKGKAVMAGTDVAPRRSSRNGVA
ncbi:hypothetical protein AZE42_11097 [Rhizopogon vesiculosus]|uniref:Uncharacterized protein n=1 Tax=Rhizopogon vesiculosus TaxID=180088 RepID=A0A1J8Q5X7_9AGAM|nr:hypothetical protein AZE42_11097 [Rhizopogon vesiculosus]